MVRDVLLGVVIGAQGLKGAVKVKTFTGAPDGLAAYGVLRLEDGRALTPTSLRSGKSGEAVVTFAEIPDRSAAEALKGAELLVARAQLPDTGTDEYYHADLLGLEARDRDGRVFGTVAAIHNFGAGDVIELKRPGGDSVHLPFTAQTVPEIDIANGFLLVAMPPDAAAERQGFVE